MEEAVGSDAVMGRRGRDLEWDDLGPRADPRPAAARRRVARLLSQLAALFARVDGVLGGFSCLGRARCCQVALTGLEPNLFPLEVAFLEEALRAQGRTWPAMRPDGGCPLLDASGRRCSTYSARPFGCRTYFCNSGRMERPYPNAQIEAFNAALTRLSDEFEEGAAPRPIREIAAAHRSSEG
jgi:Fe-S-cluster containining protein